MNVGLQEFVVKNDRPLSVIEFSVTMGHVGVIQSLPSNPLCHKGLEGVWELLNTMYKMAHNT
jgi:hypothetical protein